MQEEMFKGCLDALLTLGAFLPAFDEGNGAGAAFLPDLGGYH
jgi:hypothetical protein